MNDSSLQTVKPSALALALEGARVTPGSRYRTCSWYLLLKTSFLLLFRQKVLGYKYMNFSLLSERSALEKEGKDVKNVVAMLSSLCNTWVVHLNWSHVVISFMKLMQCCRSLSVLLWILFFLRVFKGPKFLSLSYPSLTRCWINIIMSLRPGATLATTVSWEYSSLLCCSYSRPRKPYWWRNFPSLASSVLKLSSWKIVKFCLNVLL